MTSSVFLTGPTGLIQWPSNFIRFDLWSSFDNISIIDVTVTAIHTSLILCRTQLRTSCPAPSPKKVEVC